MAITVGTVTQPYDIRSGKYLTKLRHRSILLAKTIYIRVQIIKL